MKYCEIQTPARPIKRFVNLIFGLGKCNECNDFHSRSEDKSLPSVEEKESKRE